MFHITPATIPLQRPAEAESDSPLVSVVIPAHNVARYVAETIQSVRNQTYRHLEIIVVDDGSTDATPEIVRSLAAVEPRLRLLHQPNSGVAAARNCGIRAAGGEFVAPLDADDLWHPRKIERQLEQFQQRGSEVGLVYTWTQRIAEDGTTLERDTIESRAEGDVLEALILSNIVGHGSAPLIRRTCLEEVGGYDPALQHQQAPGCEDLKLYLAIAEHYHFAVVPEHLVGYRRCNDCMSNNVWPMKRSYDLVMQEMRERLPHLPDKLFRRSRSFYCCWLAARSATLRRKGDALKLLLLTVRHDPTFVVQPWFLRKLAKILRRDCGLGWGTPSTDPNTNWARSLHDQVLAERS